MPARGDAAMEDVCGTKVTYCQETNLRGRDGTAVNTITSLRYRDISCSERSRGLAPTEHYLPTHLHLNKGNFTNSSKPEAAMPSP